MWQYFEHFGFCIVVNGMSPVGFHCQVIMSNKGKLDDIRGKLIAEELAKIKKDDQQ
jgi:hypothetical protein